MPRLTVKDSPQELLDYYDCYTHGKISKCEFFNLAAKYAVGEMTVLVLSDPLKPNYALTTQVEFIDPEVVAEYITYPSPNGHDEVRGYLVRPAKMNGRTPVVVVVHESRELNSYIEGVMRRMAKTGYIALAPGGLSSVGDYPGNDGKGRELQQQVDPTKPMNGFSAIIGFMQRYPQAIGKVGISGFCYGRGVLNTAVTVYPELACAVSFYGRQALTADVTKIEAPLLLHYAELDNRVDEGRPAYETALKANNGVYEAYIYPGTNREFYNDSVPRYGKSAADLAWRKTLEWFNKYLS